MVKNTVVPFVDLRAQYRSIKDEIDAVETYNKIVFNLRGEYAYLNKIEGGE